MLLEHTPGVALGNGGTEDRRFIVVQVADLGVHIVDALGRLEAEPVQDHLGLVGHMAQAGGFILPVAAGIAQGGVGHGSHDGVGIRVPVAGYVNRIHIFSS